MAANAETKPRFVIQAEKKYRQARRTAKAAENYLNRLNQEAAQERQHAMARNEQWIEPRGLWRKKLAANQNLAFARELEREAFTELNHAQDIARRMREFQPSPTRWPW